MALSPAINGTEQRLDVLIAEVRGLREDVAALLRQSTQTPAPSGGEVELREPKRKGGKK